MMALGFDAESFAVFRGRPPAPDLNYKLATTVGRRLVLLDEGGPADGV